MAIDEISNLSISTLNFSRTLFFTHVISIYMLLFGARGVLQVPFRYFASTMLCSLACAISLVRRVDPKNSRVKNSLLNIQKNQNIDFINFCESGAGATPGTCVDC